MYLVMLYLYHSNHHQLACYIFWWDKSFSNSINITFILCSSFNFFFWNLFFFWRLFYLSIRFLYFLRFEQFKLLFRLSSCSVFPNFWFLLVSWMLWMLFTVNKKKHMAWHGSHAWRLTYWKALVKQIFLDFFCNFVKKWLQHRCFPMKFVEFSGTLFFTEHLPSTPSFYY